MSYLRTTSFLVVAMFLASCHLHGGASMFVADAIVKFSNISSSDQSLPSCTPSNIVQQVDNEANFSNLRYKNELISRAEASGNLPEVGFMMGAEVSYNHQNLIFGWYENPVGNGSLGGDLMVYDDIDRTVKTILELDGESGVVNQMASPVSDCILVAVFLEETPNLSYLMLDSQGRRYQFGHDIPELNPDLIRHQGYLWALDGLHMAMLVTLFPTPNGSYDDPTLSSLYLTRADGSVLKPIFLNVPEEEFVVTGLAWAPDSKKIAGVVEYRDDSRRNYRDSIILIDVITTERELLSLSTQPDNSDNISRLLWSSNGEYIFFEQTDQCHQLELSTNNIKLVDNNLCIKPLPPGTQP